MLKILRASKRRRKNTFEMLCGVDDDEIRRRRHSSSRKKRNEMEMVEKFFIIRKQCVLINGKDVYEATMMMISFSSSLIFLSHLALPHQLRESAAAHAKEGRNKIKWREQ